MQSAIDVSTKSDIVNFIIFKRRLRAQLRKIYLILIVSAVIAIITLGLYNKHIFINAYDAVAGKISFAINEIFSTKINKVRVHLAKNSILADDEITDIIAKFAGGNVDNNKIKTIIADIMKQNTLVQTIYARKLLANGELTIVIKEKPIIGLFFNEDCAKDIANCHKNIITNDNQILPYHQMKVNDNVLKIYGNIGVADVNKIHKLLKKYGLLEKTAHIKFYTSGRFDLTMNNKLLLKFPRKEIENAIKQFTKMDAEYLLSTDHHSIKYIDLRDNSGDHRKIYIG